MKKLEQMLLFTFLVIILWVGSIQLSSAQQGLTNGIPDGYVLIEGDILVPKDFLQSDGIGTQSAFGDTTFWPSGVVPFVFDANVSAVNQTRMLNAMTQWETVANIDFRPRIAADQFWVHIQNSTENSSSVGRQPLANQPQIMNIVSWDNQWIMDHELAHALGFWHEQSRPDRDNYVQITSANIQPGQEHNFNIRAAADVYPLQAYGLPDDQTYDFDSVMHYGQFAFSSNGQPTITVPTPNQSWQTLIGQRNHLSRLDQLTMSFLYPQSGWRFVDRTYTGLFQFGTFRIPYKNFGTGYNSVPGGSTLWIQPGSYSAVAIYSKPMTLRAPLGNVILGP
ncbi:MAG: hypothetical protein DPW09_22665 [Anaerolineae bacterium]|nr:hypothetical protein [Anaerolineales bacterium]MCQ3976241.1 hypothetical protein [Anaerolineae bacterium]